MAAVRSAMRNIMPGMPHDISGMPLLPVSVADAPHVSPLPIQKLHGETPPAFGVGFHFLILDIGTAMERKQIHMERKDLAWPLNVDGGGYRALQFKPIDHFI